MDKIGSGDGSDGMPYVPEINGIVHNITIEEAIDTARYH